MSMVARVLLKRLVIFWDHVNRGSPSGPGKVEQTYRVNASFYHLNLTHCFDTVAETYFLD
jgi:hypothetical protein